MKKDGIEEMLEILLKADEHESEFFVEFIKALRNYLELRRRLFPMRDEATCVAEAIKGFPRAKGASIEPVAEAIAAAERAYAHYLETGTRKHKPRTQKDT